MNIVKYPGGKERELGIIQKYFPEAINDYYEPFVGGGAVYFDINADHYFINDFSNDLMNLYQVVANNDPEFFQSMEEINEAWKAIENLDTRDLYDTYIAYRDSFLTEEDMVVTVNRIVKQNKKEYINLVSPLNCGSYSFVTAELNSTIPKKFKRMKVLEFTKKHISDEDVKSNIVGIFKAMFYMYIRDLYNYPGHYTNGFKAMLYLFIRDMCYSSMFRFNAEGKFNVPYGGISYNKKNYDNIFRKYDNPNILSKMKKTTFGNSDYIDFLKKYEPQHKDFMFVDPPYDSSFSTYDKSEFNQKAQEKLAAYLIKECKCNFMLDIKYTEFIEELYPIGTSCRNGKEINVRLFDKNYSVSFMNRNNKQAQHMLITNY